MTEQERFYPVLGIVDESHTFTDADFRARVMAGKPAPLTPEFARMLRDRFVDASPTVPEFVNELVSRQSNAEHAKREAVARAAVVAKVRESVQTAVANGIYGDAWGDLYDGGFQAIAEAVVEVFVDLLRNPPTHVTHADGHTEIRWPEGES